MQDRLPQTRSDAVLQARTGHLSVLRELLPYVWPANRPDLRWRVVLALAALVVCDACLGVALLPASTPAT